MAAQPENDPNFDPEGDMEMDAEDAANAELMQGMDHSIKDAKSFLRPVLKLFVISYRCLGSEQKADVRQRAQMYAIRFRG